MSDRSVLVTGASSGIGAATVQELVLHGFDVWATVRREADADRIRQQGSPQVTPLICDVTDPAQVAALGERVRDAGPLYGLVNNAGTAIPGPLEYIPLDEFRRQLEVNLTGQLAVTQAVLPALRETRGRVVMIGSIGGRIAGPMLGPYHASKFGLLGLTDTLRAELAPAGIHVVLIEPGAVATPIWSTGAATADRVMVGLPPEAVSRYEGQIARTRADAARSARHGMPPSAVAAVIVKALTTANPRPRYLVGRDAHVLATVAAMPNRLRYRLTAARR
jgi:NAD(P)-dependent dehydrogenase (short-subunit alcohol dehydrogenase family)